MGELSLEVDEDQNRLYLTLVGSFNEEESREIADKIIGSTTRLDEGFGVIIDLSELQIGDPGAVEQLERTKEKLAENGLGVVVRIPPAARSGEMQYEEAGEESYEVEIAESIDEAEQILDGR